MGTYPPSTALILVAVMPERRDFEIARMLGWYRIPLRTAPKVIAVDYLAFYQTAAFGKQHRWCIEAFAEVKGYELTTRQELFREERDHPRAREEYFKVGLGEIQRLPQPILADKWKRITFLYTTGERMCHASTIGDLAVSSDEREILWRSLRERALQSGKYKADDLADFELDAALLLLLEDLGDNFRGN